MKIVFLGTGAADNDPAVTEKLAGRAFSAEHRRNAALLLNDRVLIDCGPGVPGALRILGIPPAQITDLLVTHTHADHICPSAVASVAAAVSAAGRPPLRVWCEPGAAFRFAGIPGLALQPLTPPQTADVSDLQVTPLFSNHLVEDSPERTLHFFIEQQNRRLFYGCDGAWLLSAEYAFLLGKQIDVFVFDGTVGDDGSDFRMATHNSLPMIRLMLQALRPQKVFAEDGRILLSHIAPTLYGMDAAAMEALLQRDGLTAACDGMTIRL